MKRTKVQLDNHSYTYLYKWEVKNPKAVLHIIHGSKEHIMRYENMIQYLNKQGITVYGMDIRGHGVSSIEQNEFGNIPSYKDLNNDIDIINDIIRKENPDTKLAMYGHSMGSFILRHYLSQNKDMNAIISGTNEQDVFTTFFGLAVARITKFFKGKKKYNKMVDNASYKAFDKKMKNGESWLSDDPEVVEKYNNSDKLSGQPFTNEAFISMLSWIKHMRKAKNYKDYNGKLLLISGSKDPVGNMGKGPTTVYKKFKKHGTNVKLNIYKDGRHEIHNDKKKLRVYKDISEFVLKS